VTVDDASRWDERYAGGSPGVPSWPARLGAALDVLPVAGRALELACGSGGAAVWLAQRGLDVLGVDVSPPAIEGARRLAQDEGVGERCRFAVADLDSGLPPGRPVDLLLCHRFRDPVLYPVMPDRLVPGGLLAIVVLTTGRFGAEPGELLAAFGSLEVLDAGEADGEAWLVGRR
jgi:SAM-dependent methyltransferase